jgi:hypothetical protein
MDSTYQLVLDFVNDKDIRYTYNETKKIFTPKKKKNRKPLFINYINIFIIISRKKNYLNDILLLLVDLITKLFTRKIQI